MLTPLRPLLLLLTLLATTALAAVPLPPEKDTWVTLTAGEFRIYSNASARATTDIATDLLRMREALGKVTRLEVRSPRPTYVFVFRNERSFAPYRDAIFGQKGASVSGGFLSGRLANFIVLDGGTEGGVDRVVYHELTHYFVRNTLAGLPLWLDEGLAEYYSTFGVSGEKVSIGRPILDHVYWLRAHPLLPLQQHFAVGHQSPEYNEDSRKGSFYAQSWALVHYLFSDAARQRQLGKFLAAVGAGTTQEEAFRTAFGGDYAALEHELRAYLKRPAIGFVNYKLAELAVPELEAMRPVSRDELLYALGSLHAWNRGTQADGEALLNEAVRLNPKHAEAHATLGFLRMARGDRAGATALFEQAIALGSRDATIYLLYGHSLVEDNPSAEETLRARQLFERAAQLDPNDARAWAGVGMTYVRAEEGDVTPGIVALEKSLSLAASEEDAALNLIQLYAHTGRRDDAQRIYDTILARSSNPESVRIGREALLLADVRVAERLYDAGRHAEAIALLRPIPAATTDAALREHLQGVIAGYDEHVVREQQIAAIGDIIEKAKAGRVKEALALLDALLPRVTDPEMRAMLTSMRKDFAGRVSRK
jgi:Flp pilus assembly protein TadD